MLCARLIHEIPEMQQLFSRKEFKETGLTDDDIAKSQEPYSDSRFDDIEKALLYVIKGGGHAFWIRAFINKKDDSQRKKLQDACRKITQVQQVHM